MNSALSLSAALSLFGAMLLLALAPSLSVATVCLRAATYGFRHGALAALGVVCGDVVYICVAMLGLAAAAEAFPWIGVALRYAGAAYLIWLGVRTWRSRTSVGSTADANPQAGSAMASFLAGFLLTLADHKAILFYLVFLPGFVDIGRTTAADVALVCLIAAVAVGGAKLAYAVLASRIHAVPGGYRSALNAGAAAVLVAVGLFLAAAPLV